MSVSITCGPPPNGKVGLSYSHTFPTTGGTPPLTFAITAGSLPPGLALTPGTGMLSGVPSMAGSYAFTVQVTDAVGSSSVACTVLVNLAVNCNAPPNGSIGTPYTHTLTTTGGTAPYTYTRTGGSLPPGLTLDGATRSLKPAGGIPDELIPRPSPFAVTPVTNGFATILDSGSNLPHAMVYAGNAIWIGCESTPGRVCRIDPLNPAVVTTIVFPDDGQHVWVVDMEYVPSKDRIYAMCSDPFDVSKLMTVVEINPNTGAWRDVITGDYASGQGALAFDSTYLYILSWFSNSIYRHLLSTFAFAGSVGTSLPNAHALIFDPVTGNLFATSAGSGTGSPMVAQVGTGSFTVDQLGFWELDKVFSDDIAIAGGYLWVGSETTGNIVKFLATNVGAPPVRILTNIQTSGGNHNAFYRNFGVYFDGGVIWTGWEGNPGYFGRVSVTTNAVELFSLPDINQANPNEWVRHGPNLYMTNYLSPGRVCQVSVTDYDPVITPAGIISGTPITAGTYSFTVHVVDSAGNTGDVTCSIAIIGSAVDCNNPPVGSIGDFYTHSITVSPSSAVASITGGALPPGLTMSSSGVITGVPTVAGNYTFTITVTSV